MATLTAQSPILPGEVRITEDDLYCCRIWVSFSGRFAYLYFYHQDRNQGRWSVHPIMADGYTIGRLGYSVNGDPDLSEFSYNEHTEFHL